MKTTLHRIALTLAVTFVLLAPASFAWANPDLYDKVLPSTGLILVPQGKNPDTLGTCWVVDHERKLVITNNHVVTDKKDVVVFFPQFSGGEVNPLREITLKSGERFVGKVVHRDVKRDLALVQLDKLPANARAMTLASKSVRPGETVHSIGNSGFNNGILWRYTRGEARIVAPYKIKLSSGLLDAFVIETQSPINQGDSGGPLVNDRGDLVGVVSAFQSSDRLITWNVDVREVRTFLALAHQASIADVARVP